MNQKIDLKEREEQAQIIINFAVQRVAYMGYGVVADGTIDGDGVWCNSLRVVPTKMKAPRVGGV